MSHQVLSNELQETEKKLEILRYEIVELTVKNENLQKENRVLRDRIKMLEV